MLTKADMEGIANGIISTVPKFVAKKLKPLLDRLDALEAQQKNLKYVGTYEAGRQYQPGNFVTCSGSLWHCDTATGEPSRRERRLATCGEKGDDDVITLAQAMEKTARELDRLIDAALAEGRAVLEANGATAKEVEDFIEEKAREAALWRQQSLARVEAEFRAFLSQPPEWKPFPEHPTVN